MEVSPVPATKDPALCTVEGCTNRRSNAGYDRLRKFCQKHHNERFNGKSTTHLRSLHSQLATDLAALEQVIREQGLVAGLEELGKLRKKY